MVNWRKYSANWRRFQKRLSTYTKPIPKPRHKKIVGKPRVTKSVQKEPRLKTSQTMRRLERMLKNGGSHTLLEWQNLLERTSHTCQGCHRSDLKLYRDHIQPVCKGGSDFISNIQPLCQKCNFKKAGKFPYTFAVSA